MRDSDGDFKADLLLGALGGLLIVVSVALAVSVSQTP